MILPIRKDKFKPMKPEEEDQIIDSEFNMDMDKCFNGNAGYVVIEYEFLPTRNYHEGVVLTKIISNERNARELQKKLKEMYPKKVYKIGKMWIRPTTKKDIMVNKIK